uniref:Bm10308 n=1 Tax=Brugia malayi TaxID=6279 RepID=A0A0J9XXP3_BRUMA|nr:Bm10308 [Brugia malayi]
MGRRRDGPMDDGQANIAEMDIYRYGDHIMTGPSVTLIAIVSLVDKAS